MITLNLASFICENEEEEGNGFGRGSEKAENINCNLKKHRSSETECKNAMLK